MRPLLSLKCLVVVSFGLLSACSLRPYYRQVLPPEVSQPASPGVLPKDVTLRLLEPATGTPIPGGRVFLSTYRGRIGMTSDENGLLTIPVSQELLTDNPLVEVILPPGVRGYEFRPVMAEPPLPPPAPEG